MFGINLWAIQENNRAMGDYGLVPILTYVVPVVTAGVVYWKWRVAAFSVTMLVMAVFAAEVLLGLWEFSPYLW